MTGLWEKQSTPFQNNWIEFINSFQKNHTNFPINSYVDSEYLNGSSDAGINRQFKNITKTLLNLTTNFDFDTDEKKKQLNEKGFKGAFVVAFYKGERISTKEALDLRTKINNHE